MVAITHNGSPISDMFEKTWSSEFCQSQRTPDEQLAYVEVARRLQNCQQPSATSDTNIFFWEEHQLPPPEVEIIKEYCCDVSLQQLKAGTGEYAQRRAARLDEREIACGNPASQKGTIESSSRLNRNQLSATELYHRLRVQRFNHGSLPDADRRLIFISDLRPHYILALMETVTTSQVPALQEAIWNHLAFRTSIQVRIPARGYQSFQLHMHIPFFVLRPSPSQANSIVPNKPTRPRKYVTDLAFLLSSNASPGRVNSVVEEAHFSLAICGSSNSRWVAYAFADSCIAYDKEENGMGVSEDEEEDDDDEGDEDEKEHLDETGLLEDPILIGNGHAGADLPIMDAREYFLYVFECRIGQSLREWQTLASALQRGFIEWDWRRRSELGKEHFEKTLHAISWLETAIDTLSTTIRSWDRFKAPGGDVMYFNRHTADGSPIEMTSQTRLSLIAIKSTFEQLEEVRQTLIMLQNRCRSAAEQLKLRLAVEGNKAMKSNETTVSFTVLFIPPLAISTSLFVMDSRPIISTQWRTSIVAFFITFLAIQISHRLFKFSRGSHFVDRILVSLGQMANGMAVELKSLQSQSDWAPRTGAELVQHTGVTPRHDPNLLDDPSSSNASKRTWHHWTCGCGQTISDEYRQMKQQNTLAMHDMNFPIGDAQLEDRFITNADTVLLSSFSNIVKPFITRQLSHSGPRLPQYASREVSSPQTQADESALSSSPRCHQGSNDTEHIYLLLCIPARKGAIKLYQDRVCQIKSDREFFLHVRSTYERQRGKTLPALSLKKVTGLYFVKFEIYYNNVVNIVETNSVPIEDLRDEYVFNSSGRVPPIGPNSMLHLYENPEDLPPLFSRLYKQVPRKLRTKLLESSVNGQEPAVGWGILIDEGFHWRMFFLYSFISFVACLLCGTTYAILRGDVQGGFTIASLLYAFTVFCGGVLHTKANV